ncbi:MAG TPA: hypothetical protein VK702_10435 [Candidatus Acidoferrum sp.]|jgi:hypothetical protein|nr:hypothetical protein [Candidatus Acidoferrum sp.]
MSVQWSERPLEPISPFPSPFGGEYATSDSSNGAGPYDFGSNGSDSISRMVQQMEQAESSSPFGSLMGMSWPAQAYGMFAQFGSMFQQMFGGASPNYGGEQYYANASGGSVGDPHLSFNGSTWNDMSSEPDLLHSDSIHGGYQLSTQTTAPNSSGITYNQSATVTTHGGGTQVTLSNNGSATLTQNGISSTIAPGASMQFGNETITRNGNGSMQITCANENGGQITTTMCSNGPGIDVNVSSSNVDLGGAMTNGSISSAGTSSPPTLPTRPIMRRYEGNPTPLVY